MHPVNQAPVRGSRSAKGEVTVLVTGFGPFQDKYPVNPSFEIAKSLPQELPRSARGGPKTNIITYGTPIRVCYETVRELVPQLHESHCENVDLVLHIGMASGRKFYTLEEIGHRDGYHKNKDLDGKALPEDDGLLRFADCPQDMTTSLDYAAVLGRWRMILRGLPEDFPGSGADCRSSSDAGHYLCDYIYFNSLAWYGRRSGNLVDGMASDRPVLFLHVPAESDEQTLANGKVVALALIEAMAEEMYVRKASLQA